MTQALFVHAPKDLSLGDVPVEIPGPGQVRIAMQRGGICGSDTHYIDNDDFGAMRRAAAAQIIAPAVLKIARAAGADIVLNTAQDVDALAPYAVGNGMLGVLCECSGAQGAQALGGAASQ